MPRFTIRDLTADGGYPLGGYSEPITDDGCPPIHGTARRVDAPWHANLGRTDTFDVPPEGWPTPSHAVPRPGVRMRPWPPRASEGFAPYPHRGVRAGRFRIPGEVFTLVLICAGVGYVCGGWELSGLLALGVSLLMLVGWVLELMYRRGMDKQFRDLLTDRWDHDLSSAPITRPRPRTRPTDT